MEERKRFLVGINYWPKEPAKLFPTLDRRASEREPGLDWIDITPEEYYERPMEHLKRLYRRFKDRFQEV